MIINAVYIKKLNGIIQNNRFILVHHIGRMESERIPAQLMDHTPRGTRSIGRA
jgi:hypothetical protein